MKNLTLAVMLTAVIVLPQSVVGHDAFKEPLEKRYGLKTVSCKTCHPDNKDRSVHNKFGLYFVEALKGKDITKKFKAAEEQGEAAVEAYEKEMVVHFNEVLKEVEQKKMSFADLIRAGLLNGTRLETKKE